MKVRKLVATLAAGAALVMTGAGAAQAAPWQHVGSFPTKAACEKKAKEMHDAGKIKDHACSPSRRGYDLGAEFR